MRDQRDPDIADSNPSARFDRPSDVASGHPALADVIDTPPSRLGAATAGVYTAPGDG
jgi:hypothetical protein